MALQVGMPHCDPRTELAALPSLGKTSAEMLLEVGIDSARELRRLGAAECYRRLRFRHGRRVTTSFMYALDCAIRDVDWRHLTLARKAELKQTAIAINQELGVPGDGARLQPARR